MSIRRGAHRNAERNHTVGKLGHANSFHWKPSRRLQQSATRLTTTIKQMIATRLIGTMPPAPLNTLSEYCKPHKVCERVWGHSWNATRPRAKWAEDEGSPHGLRPTSSRGYTTRAGRPRTAAGCMSTRETDRAAGKRRACWEPSACCAVVGGRAWRSVRRGLGSRS